MELFLHIQTSMSSEAAVASAKTGIFSSYYASFVSKFFKTSIAFASSIALLGLAGLYKFQSQLVYPMSRDAVDTPDMYGMSPYDDLRLKTVDGETLQVFVVRHDPNGFSYHNKTILILSPNAGNIGYALPIVRIIYRDMGYNVVIYSYRGYGESSGTPSEEGLKIDADTIMNYIVQDPQLSASSLILHGRSLGGAVAIYIAHKFPQMVEGLILENTFLSIRKVIPYIFPPLKWVAFMCHQHWNSEELISQIPSDIPVLMLAGAADEIVPPSHMKKLAQLCPSTDIEFHEFANATHNDTIIQPEYWDFVWSFTKQKVNPRGY